MSIRSVVFCLALAGALCAQTHPDFSGTWQQVNERCDPKPRNAAYVYRAVVDQHGDSLNVDIATAGTREAGDLHLRYEIAGKEMVYTGLDHDEFHVKAHWSGDQLIFQIVEHERGHENNSTETWSLLDGGKTLKRVKQEANNSRVYILEKR